MVSAAIAHREIEQGLLLDLGTPVRIRDLDGAVERRRLSDGAWIDLRRHWVDGADSVFAALGDGVDWRSERRPMYDRVVDVPRLVAFHDHIADVPHPSVAEAGAALTEYYRDVLPEGFATAGLCLYRGGDDSVAWHGDTIGRGATDDTLVAILSLGAPRALALRPRSGGPSFRVTLDSGDLLVMGGSCQRTWEHAVPKTARPVAPRISIQFRPAGVR